MKYFAYGMNTNQLEMATRCPGAVCLGMAWIDDFQLCFRTHCDIEQNLNARTYGVLWEIDKNNLRSLDVLEGFPYYYNRFHVKVQTENYFVFALTYQMNDQSYLQQPGSGYLNMITEGYRQNAVPTDQIDQALNTVSCFLSAKTKLVSKDIWSPMIKDHV